MYAIENFREICLPENIVVTQHGRRRLVERNITINDIINTIKSGEIIEDYPEDYPFPSCLIYGESFDKKIHVVGSISDGMLYVITAYEPNPGKWDESLKKRREL